MEGYMDERKGKEGKWQAWEGRGYRHALVPLNWSLITGHKTRLAPYTSSLHVKGRLHCPGLTAYLTCLDWKKREISLPVSLLTPSPVLTNQLAGHFYLQTSSYWIFKFSPEGERAVLLFWIWSSRISTGGEEGFKACIWWSLCKQDRNKTCWSTQSLMHRELLIYLVISLFGMSILGTIQVKKKGVQLEQKCTTA